MIEYKSYGFSDAHIADALNGFKPTGWKALPKDCNEETVMHCRHELKVHPRYRMVDPVPLNSLQRHRTTTRPTNPSKTMVLTMFRIWISETNNVWLLLVQDRFELVRGLNSTMGVCMQSWLFVLLNGCSFHQQQPRNGLHGL